MVELLLVLVLVVFIFEALLLLAIPDPVLVLDTLRVLVLLVVQLLLDVLVRLGSFSFKAAFFLRSVHEFLKERNLLRVVVRRRHHLLKKLYKYLQRRGAGRFQNRSSACYYVGRQLAKAPPHLLNTQQRP